MKRTTFKRAWFEGEWNGAYVLMILAFVAVIVGIPMILHYFVLP